MERLKRFLARRRPRGWRGWLRLATLTVLVCQLLAFVGAFSPFVSPVIYSQLAPTGWHNVTPHGKIELDDFAASATSPGLMVACGTSFLPDITDPSIWKIDGFRFWLSHDGGATWQALHPPLADGNVCDVGLEPDSSIMVTMQNYSLQNYSTTTTATWLSHNLGKTWQHESPPPIVFVDGKSATVVPKLRRGGILYGSYNTNDPYSDDAPAVSSDNGKTWTPLTTTPSALVKEGWWVGDDFVPDYRSEHWWFRTLYTDGKIPMLEHSMDDGRSWTLVGPIGSAFTGEALLGVNPSQPGRLCAEHWYGETDHLSLLSSPDGGVTWRAGAMPPMYGHTSGESSGSPEMDAQGNCYQGYHFGRGGPPGIGSNGSHYVFLRLPPQADNLQPMPITRGVEDGNVYSNNIMYVPAGNGMSARLVIQAWVSYSSWAGVFSGLAGETDSGQLVWTAVP